MKTYQLFTIGYEGRDIREFVDRLKTYKVTRLLDVRQVPFSRKKGFSKSALQEILEAENIEYVHLQSLGTPTALRNELKENKDYDHFFDAYGKYLSKHLGAVKEAYEFLSEGTNCIMCFERHPHECHRQVVAKKIKEYDGNGLLINHI